MTVAVVLSIGEAPLKADLAGPYAPDANTLFLYHFDEPSGSSATANVGTKGGTSYTVQNDATGNGNPAPPVVTDLLGAPGYTTNTINFGNSARFHTLGYLMGYDFDASGTYDADVQGGPVSPDRFAMTNLNFGNGGQTPFTLEALIAPTNLLGAQQIICTDSYAGGNRGFQFRVFGGVLQLQMLDGATFFAITTPIPTTGFHGFTNGNWYHAAVTYDGSTAKLYWTRVDPTVTAANQIASQSAAITIAHGAVLAPLVFGNDNRGASGEKFSGRIDEVRISSIARGPGEMQFFSPAVTIVANPISQNVDYSEPVRFSVTAASPTPMGFQWRLNGDPISGASSNIFAIPQVSAADAGTYDVVVTNTAGFSSTSSPAVLVVGAANFLAHRYSFNGNANDSIGTAHGTNFGNAMIVDGALVLDGTIDTYTELPGGLLNGLNSVTVDFWATFGENLSAVRVFDFGNSVTNFTGNLAGFNYLFFSPNLGGAHRVTVTPGDAGFEQNAIGNGILDGQTVHVTCVVDPPNERMLIYTNGVLEVINTNLTAPLSALNNVLSYIGKSMYAVDPYLNGSIDELRIYNGALSPITVQQNHEQGPNIVLSDGPVEFVVHPSNLDIPIGQTAVFSATATGYLPIHYQWYKAGVAAPGATNSTYAFTALAGDNGAQIQVFATNVIGATTYLATSSVATLTTFNPPTLAWIGGDGSWNATSPNWTNVAGGPLTAFSPHASVLFDNRAELAYANVVEDVNPSVVTANGTVDHLITSFGGNGSLVGQGRIVKQNSGTLVIDLTNSMSGGALVSAGTLQIGSGGSTGTPGAGAITNNATLAFNRSDTVALPNAVSGSGTLRQNGSGAVAISGNNTYTGQTLINSGVVFLQSSNALGSTSAGTVVASGGQLYITANVDVGSEPLTLNGLAGDSTGALRKGGAGATTYGGTVNLATDSSIGVDGDATLTLGNSMSGSGVLTKNGAGTLVLAAPGSRTGGTVLSSGILQLNADNAAGSGGITADGGRVVLGGGVTLTNAVTFNSVSPGVATGAVMMNDSTSNPVATVSGPVVFNGDALNGGHFAGPIASGLLNVNGPVNLASGSILQIRLGNVRFGGTGSYPEIHIRADTTSLGTNNAISTSAVMDIGGNGSTTVPTTFDLNGFNQMLAGLKTDVAPANVAWVTNSGAGQSTLTLEPSGGTYAYNGSIVGNVSLVLLSGNQMLGSNGVPLSGLYRYTGNTIVSGGTLALGTGISIPNTAVIDIAAGATLDVSASGLSIGVGQTLKGNGTFNVGGNLTNNGTIELKLSKSGGTLANDSIQGLGHIAYGGTLKLNVTASPALTTSDSFKLFHAGSYSGSFAGFNPPIAGPGLSWDQSTLATDGTLRVMVGGVDPTPTNITATVSGSTLTLSWPGSHLGWILQTNAAGLAATNSWFAYPGSASVTSIPHTIDRSRTNVFFRLISP
jgi:autotransporter-associated beta strand protein